MQTSPPIPLSLTPISMKDAHSAQSNEKSIFRFLQFIFFELWLIVFTIYQIFSDEKMFKSCQIYRKDEDCSENIFLVHESFLVFEIWSILNMVDFDVYNLKRQQKT